MTTSVITASTVGNVEKMRRNRPRHRGTTMESESRMIFTPREKSVYRQLDHARIAAQIGTTLLTDFGGELEFIELRDFVSTMETHGVINRRVVHDIAIRTSTIASVVHSMMNDGRLVGGYEMKAGRRVGFLMLSPDESELRNAQIKRRQAKAKAKRIERDRLRKEARANGQPLKMTRRQRRRQAAHNQARALAAQKKGRSSAMVPSTRAA